MTWIDLPLLPPTPWTVLAPLLKIETSMCFCSAASLHLNISSGKNKCHRRSEARARGRDSLTAFSFKLVGYIFSGSGSCVWRRLQPPLRRRAPDLLCDCSYVFALIQ